MKSGTIHSFEKFEVAMKTVFTPNFEEDYIAKNFCVSEDMKSLLQLLTGTLIFEDWLYVYCISSIPEGTKDYCEIEGKRLGGTANRGTKTA